MPYYEVFYETWDVVYADSPEEAVEIVTEDENRSVIGVLDADTGEDVTPE